MTTPLADTDAIVALAVCQRTSVLTPASACTAALSVRCSPSLRATLLGDTVTVGAARTVTDAVARLVVSPAARAVMVTLPTARVVTSPMPEIDATEGFELRQITAVDTPTSPSTVADRRRTSPMTSVLADGVINAHTDAKRYKHMEAHAHLPLAVPKGRQFGKSFQDS